MNAQERFEAIYDAHAAVVKRYALRRAAASEADDIVAEVFLTAWRRLEELPGEPRGWLLGVARRVASNTRRGDDRRAALRERLVAERPACDQLAAPSSQLAEALLSLGAADREALTLIAWDGLTQREAAQVMGIREGAFGVRLHRARKRLQRAMARSGQGAKTTTKPLEAR